MVQRKLARPPDEDLQTDMLHAVPELLASAGLLTQFGLQALVNMASSLHLMPTKGMTLPFISYGGSSALAMAICVGMMLSLTREHAGLREAV